MQSTDSKSILWHYTMHSSLVDILRLGEIRLPPPPAKGEKPVIWFSKNPIWEPTASKQITAVDGSSSRELTMEQTAILGNGLGRIGVDSQTAPHDWRGFKALSGAATKVTTSLYNDAHKKGAKPKDWYVSFSSVPKSAWVSVETWDGFNPLGWVTYDFQGGS